MTAGTDPYAVLDELARLPTEQRLRREMELVADLVDLPYYAVTVPDVLEEDLDPLEHFCSTGWQELRKPSQNFDVWWYWVNHLDPADDSVNPLVHYALIGKEQGLSTRPDSTRARPGLSLPTDRPVRRACLVAGFDADGVVDPSVVDLIAELSRHGDVFYLFDGQLAADELTKLSGITKGAWAIRHEAYDFGSYSMLAGQLLGWERLEEYDEVVFANDSCFLVRPLDEVFETMAQRDCDWWGLQATKGLASTRYQRGNDFTEPIPLDVVRESLLSTYEDDPIYDFLVGSYFLAFRRPVLEDPKFRALISSVHQQPSKLLIIQKYEVGLTHLLVGRGFSFDTFIPALYPFHPVFTEWYFELLKLGFPLLKRYFIYRNHYDVPGLARWKERVLEAAPDANVDQFERTLRRTAPDHELRRSLSITEGEDGAVEVPEPVSGSDFKRWNRRTKKRPDWWVFAVDLHTHRLPDNSRAIFEAVKDDPDITKIILTRSRRIELTGTNVVMESVNSPAGRQRLVQSGTAFFDFNTRRTLDAPVVAKHQRLIMVREGLLLEKTGRTRLPAAEPNGPSAPDDLTPRFHRFPPSTVTGLLVASDVDQLAALATHWPASFEHTWRTGIPAHDFLLGEQEALPADLQVQLAALRRELGGRRLLLFSPALRRVGTDSAPYEFSEAEIGALASWCDQHGYVLGLRESDRDLGRAYSSKLGALTLDLSHRRYPSLHAVMRAADGMLTDYSGFALDFACTGKPVVSFVHDMAEARDRLLYDLDHFFPGPVCTEFDALESALDVFVGGPTVPHAERVRNMLVDHRDGRNTERVLARLMAEAEGTGA